MDIDDDGKLLQKYRNKKVNARKEGIEFDLAFKDLCILLANAGLKSSDWGFTAGHNFVLARYNDSGSYAIDNCRFITQTENNAEKIVSDSSREASRQNIKKVDHEKRMRAYKESKKYQEYCRLRKEKAIVRAELWYQTLHPSYRGEKNSNFGTYWLTDGIHNIKWKDSKGIWPEGYYKGRICA